MEGMSGPPELAAQLDQRGDVEEGARIDRLRDAHDVLRHDAAGAEVQMPDFAVADLAFGEAHGETGRVEQRAWRLRPEAMPGGRPAELDRVPHLAGTEAPAIEFFQAEDGIRDVTVTGVQTCALPI